MRTRQVFSSGAILEIEITCRRGHFVAGARVAYSLESKGMGLLSLNVQQDNLRILDDCVSSLGPQLPA